MDWHGYRPDLHCPGGCDAGVIIGSSNVRFQQYLLPTFTYLPLLMLHVKRRARPEPLHFNF